MGDFGSKRWRSSLAWAALPVAAFLLVACSSAPQPAMAVSRTAVVPVGDADMPVRVRAVELRTESTDTVLDVVADGPLVWTSFRDPEGRLVIDLPNAVPADELTGLLPSSGMVSAVDVVDTLQGDASQTRLVIATRSAVEHAVVGGGDSLQIRLTPIDPVAAEPAATVADDGAGPVVEPIVEPQAEPRPATVLAYEPLPAEPEEIDTGSYLERDTVARQEGYANASNGNGNGNHAAEPQTRLVSNGAAYPAAAGTAEDPFVAPPPSGAPASLLGGVDVERTDHGTQVRVVGDGQFDYSTFALADPHRFVIDLAGVHNGADTGSVAVGGVVERVRMAQFRGGVDPVSRVVFDLAQPIVPRIVRTSDALVVDFGELNGNSPSHRAAALSPAPAPAAAPVYSAPQDDGMAGDEMMDDGMVADDTMAEDGMNVEMAGLQDDSVTDALADDDGRDDVIMESPEGEPEVAMPAMADPVAPAPRESASDLDLYSNTERGIEITTPQPSTARDPFATRTLGQEEREYVGERYDYSLRDADLVETLRSFAVMSNLNIVIQPGVRGTVTVELRDVPWDQAFEQILKINGLSYEVEGNIMRIAPTQTLQNEAQARRQLEAAKALSIPLTTVIRRLSYAQASNVAGILSAGGGILSQRGNVIVDQRTNTLIIKELPEFIDTVIAVIENLDIPEPLVMIEARIVETRKNFTRTLGIEWGFGGVSSPATGNTTGLVFPNNGAVDGGVSLLTGGANGFLDISLGNVLNTFNLDATLQAAENEGLVNILSAPKVQALNNERASIQSGFQIPIQTVANNTVSVQFVNATLRLDVTPQVTAEGTVLMDISIQKRNPEFGLTVAGAQNAPISTKEATTRVIVRDGGTTVIGGIYEVTTNQGEDRVPGLANVPIIGHLFKNKRRTDENSELLIFITPRVVKL